MSFEQVTHNTFQGHPHIHVFTMTDPAGSVVYRTDTMQQVICAPRGAEMVEAVLSGRAGPDALPPEVRELVCKTSDGLPVSSGLAPRTSAQDVVTLYLVPTLDCQLGCDYCRITRKQGGQAGLRLSPEMACDAIDRVLGRAPSGRRRTVAFFGGEPLLVPETVFSAVSHVRGGPEGGNTDIMLQTNGIGIDAETARFLAEHDVFVLLSLDGVAEVHDQHRKLLSGMGSYEGSVRGYCNAKEHGCRMGISATATKETADRFCSSFQEMLVDLVPDGCGAVTHLHPMTGARSPHQCSPTVAADVLRETFLAARELGIYHQQMCERIGPFVNGTWRRYACAGCGGKVVVAPDGRAGICEYNAGDGRSYVALDEFSEDTVSDFLRWAGRSPLDTKECVACPALPTCGGGCAYDSQELMGDALRFDPWLCETNVRITHWLMRDLLAHLHDRLEGQEFHVVTSQERALVLGRINLEEALGPVWAVGRGRTVRRCCECAAG